MRSPFAAFVEHADACPCCTAIDPCPIGRALRRTALHMAVVFTTPIPPIPRSPYKA